MQSVSVRPPSPFQKLPNFFFSQAVFPAFGEETQFRSLWLFGAEAGFPPLAFPESTGGGENPPEQHRKPFGSPRWNDQNPLHELRCLLISSSSVALDSASFRWHACVQQTQHCALWLWCVLFRPSRVATLSPPPICLSAGLRLQEKKKTNAA